MQERLKSSESCDYFISSHVQEVTFHEAKRERNFLLLKPKVSDTLPIQTIGARFHEFMPVIHNITEAYLGPCNPVKYLWWSCFAETKSRLKAPS